MPQKIIFYTQVVCYPPITTCLDSFYDVRHHTNDTEFQIDFDEDVIIVLKSCGNHWFRHSLSTELQLRQGFFRLKTDMPYQQCVWIKNLSSATALYVEKGTTLSSLLSQSEIAYKLCHMKLVDLACHNEPVDMNISKSDNDKNNENDEDIDSVNNEEEEEEEKEEGEIDDDDGDEQSTNIKTYYDVDSS